MKKKDRRNVTFYNCNKRGHYRLDCPLLKKKPKKNKKSTLLDIWEDSDTSSSDEEEEEIENL